MEGLQQGMNVTDVRATNYGDVLPPYLRKQYEYGTKATLGNTLVTLAYFDITSALQYYIPATTGDPAINRTYVQSGQQVSKGVEFSATGEVTDGLRVLAGFMFANSEITNNEQDPTLNGTVPQWSVTKLAKLTAEYDLPFLQGLTITGGAYYTGGAYFQSGDNLYLPGYTTYDAGMRYATKVGSHDVIARFNVSNLTDLAYYTAFGFVVDPRPYSFTLQTLF